MDGGASGLSVCRSGSAEVPVRPFGLLQSLRVADDVAQPGKLKTRKTVWSAQSQSHVPDRSAADRSGNFVRLELLREKRDLISEIVKARIS